MLIIIEGPDGAGKTTLAKTLENLIRREEPEAKVEVWHRGAPKSHALNEYALPLFDYRPGRGHHIICDRWHLGELVYSRVRRNGETTMTPGVRRWIEMFLASRGAYVVGIDLMTERDYADVYRYRGDPHIVSQLAELRMVRQMYDELGTHYYFMIGPGVATDDAETLADFDRSTANVMRAAQRRERAATRLNDFVTYVGDPTPNVLVVGDVRHRVLDVCEDPMRPAFMPYPPTSGNYLMAALEVFARTYGRHSVALVNANDVDDVRAAWERVGRPSSVVALGTYAHKTLQRINVSHGMVPHPQYARRFHFSQVDRYADALVGAAFRNERITSWPHC